MGDNEIIIGHWEVRNQWRITNNYVYTHIEQRQILPGIYDTRALPIRYSSSSCFLQTAEAADLEKLGSTKNC